MTIPIETANIRSENLVEPYSRYYGKPVIYYSELRKITFETYIREPYQRTGNEKVMIVNRGVEYRPDLVSYDVYGNPDLWWKILEANNMKDIWEFKAGVTIFLPNIL